MRRKMVYIASPYTLGDVAMNVRRQFDIAEQLVACGYIPYPPLYSHFWHMIYPHPSSYWMKLDFKILSRCDYLLRLEGESIGADYEVRFATRNSIPVFHSIKEMIDYDATQT